MAQHSTSLVLSNSSFIVKSPEVPTISLLFYIDIPLERNTVRHIKVCLLIRVRISPRLPLSRLSHGDFSFQRLTKSNPLPSLESKMMSVLSLSVARYRFCNKKILEGMFSSYGSLSKFLKILRTLKRSVSTPTPTARAFRYSYTFSSFSSFVILPYSLTPFPVFKFQRFKVRMT